MTKSANVANREIVDYTFRAMREVPDGETIDMIEADNNLEPLTDYAYRVHGLARGIMEVEIVTLHVRDGVTIRRTYQMTGNAGLLLVDEQPELARHVP